jgi:hypothetical protein
LISYLRSSTTDIIVRNEGDIDIDRKIKYTKTVRLEMEDEQERKYKDAYKKDSKKYKDMSVEDEIDDDADLDEDDPSKALWNNSRQAALFTSFDADFMSIFAKSFETVFNKLPTYGNSGRVVRLKVCERDFINKYLDYGLSDSKYIPDVMMMMEKESVRKFLSFMLGAEGGVAKKV